MGLHYVITELFEIQKPSPYTKAYSDWVFFSKKISIQNPEPGNSEIFGFVVKLIIKIGLMFYF